MSSKYKRFIKLCKMPQATLKQYVSQQLRLTHPKVISEDGFVFAEGTFPVLLVAHLDTVHRTLPQQITYPYLDAISSPQGIGGDDRCGVYMIFEVLKKFNCSVLFCEDEEIGGIGAEKFIESKYAKSFVPNYIIEFDRRGKNDAVFYNCDNPKFTEFITKEFYQTAYGSFSDISILAPYIYCAAVNLSCGYYNAHTTSEYVVFPEMEASIAAACDILARTTDDDRFSYIKAQHKWADDWEDFYYNSQDIYEDLPYVIEYEDERGEIQDFTTFAMSEEEALGKFVIKNPTRCFDDIVSFYVDEITY